MRFLRGCGKIETRPADAVNIHRPLTDSLGVSKERLMRLLSHTPHSVNQSQRKSSVQPARLRAGVSSYPDCEVMPTP